MESGLTDGIVQRFTRGFIPDNSGLPLVGDTNSLYILRTNGKVSENGIQ